MRLEDDGLGLIVLVKLGHELKHSEGWFVSDSFKRPVKRPLATCEAKHGCSSVEPGEIGPATFPNAGPVFKVSHHYKILLSIYHTYKNNGTAFCGIWQTMQFLTCTRLV
jgi:hypothetical protein